MKPFILLLLVASLFVQGYAQGIKGSKTRRHTITLSGSKKADSDRTTGRNTSLQNQCGLQDSTIGGKYIFILGSNSPDGHKECRAACTLIDLQHEFGCMPGTWDDIRKNKESFSRAEIVWLHWNDSIFGKDEMTQKRVINHLREYVEHGGKLLLTGDAVPLINRLDFEQQSVSTRLKTARDEGYGRKLGFHAFREHPLFNKLHGGAYVFMPQHDTAVRIHGFFGDTLPKQGKVVAVDWDYIFLREHSKMILEYEPGGGKVLAIGGYMALAMPNQNRDIMQQFLENSFQYLINKPVSDTLFYWTYQSPRVVSCTNLIRQYDKLFAMIPEAKAWQLPPAPVSFSTRGATNNYMEVAGERMLLMGTENGAVEEVWAHPFMALRDLYLGILASQKGDTLWLDQIENSIEIRPDAIIRKYPLQNDTLTVIITVDPDYPTGVLHLQHDGTDQLDLVVSFHSNLRLMWPYPASATQVINYQWNGDYSALQWADQSGDFCGIFGANNAAVDHQVRSAGYSSHAAIQVEITYKIAPRSSLDLILTAGSEGCDRNLVYFDEAVRDPYKVFQRAYDHTEDLLAQSLVIHSPDTNFNQGYLWALLGTDRFFVRTPDMGKALVAGYATTRRGWDGSQKISGRPGYGWYFGRDGQWSGMAVLDYGDLQSVRENLEFFIRYQAPSGKIFHEATTSGVIHYDAADATPLFVVLAGKYFRHSGDTRFLNMYWPAIKKAIDFCFSTDTDKDDLIENTMIGHGWVEGGDLFGCHSTLYLQGCWIAALEEAFPMATTMNDPDAMKYRAQAKKVKQKVNQLFWLNQQGYFGYGLDASRTIRSDNTILQTVPAYFGVFDRIQTNRILKPFSSNGFTTNWGVRIIDEANPKFKPTGYHHGSVWPLFTGWTALAEYNHGRAIQGFSHLMNNLNVYQSWGKGYVEEVLNGAEYQPSGVCSHQCWSETMVLQPAIEGLLGLKWDVPEKKLQLAPALPANWDSLTASPIQFGSSEIDFQFVRTDSIYAYALHFSNPEAIDRLSFMPLLPLGTKVRKVLVNGQVHPYTTLSIPEGLVLLMPFDPEDDLLIECYYSGGIAVLPILQQPKIGSPPEGFRILDASLQGDDYLVETEALSGTRQTLKVWQNGQVTKVLVVSPEGEEKYQRVKTTIKTRRP